jgi:predicted nucleic acid-binding protein
MQVVIDANILISIIISRWSDKADTLFSGEVEAASPDWIMLEIGKYWHEISKKSGLSSDELKGILSIVREKVRTYSLEEFSDKMEEAERQSPDIKDAEYLALALKLNCPLWSDDKALRRQGKVRVMNTEELKAELKA